MDTHYPRAGHVSAVLLDMPAQFLYPDLPTWSAHPITASAKFKNRMLEQESTDKWLTFFGVVSLYLTVVSMGLWITGRTVSELVKVILFI